MIGGVFNSGILATGPRPGAMFDYAPASQAILERASAIEKVCLSHGVPLAAAALQFPLASDLVASVLLGVSNVRNLERNLEGLKRPIPESAVVGSCHTGSCDRGLISDAKGRHFQHDLAAGRSAQKSPTTESSIG